MPDAPPELARFFSTALQPEPERRFADAVSYRVQLEAVAVARAPV
jgi:hypothetical protein